MTDAELKRAKRAYGGQKSTAKIRGVEWQFTFETWLQWWLDSGHWHERGRGIGKYQMCRIGDVGPYSPDNCFAGLYEQNVCDGNIGKQHSEEHKRKISKNSGKAKAVSINGIIYASQFECHRQTGIPIRTISDRLKRKVPGYHYV